MNEPYYVANPVFCSECGRHLRPAPAFSDGEPCFIGYLPCKEHPRAEPIWNTHKIARIQEAQRLEEV